MAKEILGQFDEHGLEEAVKQLILTKMVCFGPNPAGTNLLLVQNIKGKSFFERLSTETFDL